MTQGEDYGFLTGFLRKVFFALDEIPSRLFLGRRSKLKLSREADMLKRNAQKRAIKVDLYVSSWVLVELICVCALGEWHDNWPLCVLVTFACSLRIAEVFLSNTNLAIFRVATNPTVASVLRILILTIINDCELWLCFAGIYAAHSQLLTSGSAWDAVYFSGITQLTIGYGDIKPSGWLRGVVLLQGWLGTMFALLILGRLVGIMPTLQEIGADALREDERFQNRK